MLVLQSYYIQTVKLVYYILHGKTFNTGENQTFVFEAVTDSQNEREELLLQGRRQVDASERFLLSHQGWFLRFSVYKRCLLQP